MEKKIDISFQIVNCDSLRDTKNLIKEIRKKVRCPYEIIISNNDLSPIPSIITKDEHVRVIENKENIGFGAAHNIAAQKACGEVLCIINPDISQITKNIDDLVSLFDNASIGIVAPRVCDTDQQDQEWSYDTKDITPWNLLKNNILPTARYEHNQRINAQKNDCSLAWVTGATFFIPKKIFEMVDGFDEGFFLYYEDVDFCRRVRHEGYQICRDISYSVQHASGMSSPDKKKQKEEYFISQDYYFSKYYGAMAMWCVRIARKLFYRI